MKIGDFAFFLIPSLLFTGILGFSKEESGKDKDAPSLKAKKIERVISCTEKIENHIDTMKVRDVIILAKYAQGGVIFSSFFEHVRHMKEDERETFLLQIVTLIKKLGPQDSDAAIAIKKSELNADCKQSVILREGVTDQKLEELLKLQDEDLEDTFKVLLNLFAEGYRRAYALNRNNASKFWYWDYSIPATSLQIVELDTKQEIDISNF